MKKIRSQIKESALYYYLKYFCSYDKLSKTIVNTEQVLEEFSPRPYGTIIAGDRDIEIKYDCQIILPIYNSELYIKECIDSILSQKTHYTYHIICVNDGSTDRTAEILNEYINNTKITIIHQKNQGVSVARNVAMKKIVGRYLMFVDSDDVLLENAIENMLTDAYESNSDVILGQYKDYDGKKFYQKQYEHAVIKDKSKVVFSDLGGFLWNKLYKYELFNNIKFPEYYWYEDTIMSLVFFSDGEMEKNKTVFCSDICFYGYRENDAGLSRGTVGKKKSIDTLYITELCCNARAELGRKIDYKFLTKIEKQIIVNYNRTKKLPSNIQVAVFCRTRDFLAEFLKKYNLSIGLKYVLLKTILKNNYGGYRYICQRGYEQLKKIERM